MAQSKLAEDLLSWMSEELGYRPLQKRDIPTRQQLEGICRGYINNIFKFLMRRIYSKKKVQTVRDNIQLQESQGASPEELEGVDELKRKKKALDELKKTEKMLKLEYASARSELAKAVEEEKREKEKQRLARRKKIIFDTAGAKIDEKMAEMKEATRRLAMTLASLRRVQRGSLSPTSKWYKTRAGRDGKEGLQSEAEHVLEEGALSLSALLTSHINEEEEERAMGKEVGGDGAVTAVKEKEKTSEEWKYVIDQVQASVKAQLDHPPLVLNALQSMAEAEKEKAEKVLSSLQSSINAEMEGSDVERALAERREEQYQLYLASVKARKKADEYKQKAESFTLGDYDRTYVEVESAKAALAEWKRQAESVKRKCEDLAKMEEKKAKIVEEVEAAQQHLSFRLDAAAQLLSDFPSLRLHLYRTVDAFSTFVQTRAKAAQHAVHSTSGSLFDYVRTEARAFAEVEVEECAEWKEESSETGWTKNKPASTYLIHRGDMDEYVRKAKKEVERVGEMGSAMQVVHDIVQATTAGEAEKKVADSAKSLIAHTSSSLPLLTSASTSVNSSMAEVEKAKNEKWIPSLVEASRECEESVRLSEKIREELDYWWRQGEAELVEWMEVDGMNVQEWRQEWNRLTNNDV